jgi:hypothetical protein
MPPDKKLIQSGSHLHYGIYRIRMIKKVNSNLKNNSKDSNRQKASVIGKHICTSRASEGGRKSSVKRKKAIIR